MKKISAQILFVFIFFLLSMATNVGVYASEEEGGNMIKVIDEIKKTVVFLGSLNDQQKPRFYGTGFLIQIEGIFHLVTAKHVIFDSQRSELTDSNLIAFFNRKDGQIGGRLISDIKKDFGVDWIFHTKKEVDVAVIPFGLDLAADDVKVIPSKLFLPSNRIFELYDIFFLSYQPGIEPTKQISPVFRNGIVSTKNDDNTFYVDASAFPGNSGSPVFLKPSPIRFDQNRIALGGDPLGGKFIGIIGEYVPYQEVAVSLQTKRPRVVFEENTGLSKVWPVEFINQIFESNNFKQQLSKMKSGGKQTSALKPN